MTAVIDEITDKLFQTTGTEWTIIMTLAPDDDTITEFRAERDHDFGVVVKIMTRSLGFNAANLQMTIQYVISEILFQFNDFRLNRILHRLPGQMDVHYIHPDQIAQRAAHLRNGGLWATTRFDE